MQHEKATWVNIYFRLLDGDAWTVLNINSCDTWNIVNKKLEQWKDSMSQRKKIINTQAINPAEEERNVFNKKNKDIKMQSFLCLSFPNKDIKAQKQKKCRKKPFPWTTWRTTQNEKSNCQLALKGCGCEQTRFRSDSAQLRRWGHMIMQRSQCADTRLTDFTRAIRCDAQLCSPFE